MLAREGDWIITDVNGERYPIKPDIFGKTYDIVKRVLTDDRLETELAANPPTH